MDGTIPKALPILVVEVLCHTAPESLIRWGLQVFLLFPLPIGTTPSTSVLTARHDAGFG